MKYERKPTQPYIFLPYYSKIKNGWSKFRRTPPPQSALEIHNTNNIHYYFDDISLTYKYVIIIGCSYYINGYLNLDLITSGLMKSNATIYVRYIFDNII